MMKIPFLLSCGPRSGRECTWLWVWGRGGGATSLVEKGGFVAEGTHTGIKVGRGEHVARQGPVPGHLEKVTAGCFGDRLGRPWICAEKLDF